MNSFHLTYEALSVELLVQQVQNPKAGAIATFLGVTRNNNLGEQVQSLEYEAYEAMALKKLKQIGIETQTRFKIIDIAIWHRLGIVHIGETSVAIAVSSAHRKSALEACHFAIDRLKEIVPIFKKEYFAQSGARWVPNHTS